MKKEKLKDLSKGEADERIEEEKYELGEPEPEELAMPETRQEGENLLEEWRERAGRVHDSFSDADREVHPESGESLSEAFEGAYA